MNTRISLIVLAFMMIAPGCEPESSGPPAFPVTAPSEDVEGEEENVPVDAAAEDVAEESDSPEEDANDGGTSEDAGATPDASDDAQQADDDGVSDEDVAVEDDDATTPVQDDAVEEDDATEDVSGEADTGEGDTSVCEPACDGKACGDDGCGGVCGECGDYEVCEEAQCIISCDSDPGCVEDGLSLCLGESLYQVCSEVVSGCFKWSQPENCAVNQICTGGSCVCAPDCAGKACGPDGCGGTCGACGDGEFCESGMCSSSCTSDAGCESGTGAQCLADSSGVQSCTEVANNCFKWNEGTLCGSGEVCDGGSCVCQPDCEGKECEDDGCGGICGICGEGTPPPQMVQVGNVYIDQYEARFDPPSTPSSGCFPTNASAVGAEDKEFGLADVESHYDGGSACKDFASGEYATEAIEKCFWNLPTDPNFCDGKCGFETGKMLEEPYDCSCKTGCEEEGNCCPGYCGTCKELELDGSCSAPIKSLEATLFTEECVESCRLVGADCEPDETWEIITLPLSEVYAKEQSGDGVEAICAQTGKRVCDLNTWQSACDGLIGPGGTVYPYGDSYNGQTCNTETFTASKSGEFPDCSSDTYPVFDLIGNYQEIVKTSEGELVLVGGSFLTGVAGNCGAFQELVTSADSCQGFCGVEAPSGCSCSGVSNSCADYDEVCNGPSELVTVRCCSAPSDDLDEDGYPALNDCNDNNPNVNPGVVEICNGLDDDCDGIIDNGIDQDFDGATLCEDCNDLIGSYNPGAPDNAEDGLDQNCDGIPGVDGDLDGYASLASGGTDCDDDDPYIHPDAYDVFGNGIDNNCDGVPGVDKDQDGDASLASGGSDCEDNQNAVSSLLGDEFGDSWDTNCDGVDGIDEDGDGNASVSSGGTDCDDQSPDVYGLPSQVSNGQVLCEETGGVWGASIGWDTPIKICGECGWNQVCVQPFGLYEDSVCIQEDLVGTYLYFNPPADSFLLDWSGLVPSLLDTSGECTVFKHSFLGCDGPDLDDASPYGYLWWCLDGPKSVCVCSGEKDKWHPIWGCVEDIPCEEIPDIYEVEFDSVNNGVDNNCDGVPGVDGDGDGQASIASGGLDCDDLDAEVYVGAFEPAGVDKNCDGLPGIDADDDGFVPVELGGLDCDDNDANTYPGSASSEDMELCTKDTDGDGYGDNEPGSGIDPGNDCDDNDANTYPGSASSEDMELCTKDTDGDGYGDDEPGSGIDPGNDCDDGSNIIYPGASDEVNNGTDNNCDGIPGVDADDDGFASEVSGGVDCDDEDEESYPGVEDLFGDGIDQNCDQVDGIVGVNGCYEMDPGHYFYDTNGFSENGGSDSYLSDTGCNDSDPCTLDLCQNSTCSYFPIDEWVEKKILGEMRFVSILDGEIVFEDEGSVIDKGGHRISLASTIPQCPVTWLPKGVAVSDGCTGDPSVGECDFVVESSKEIFQNLSYLYRNAAIYYSKPHVQANGQLVPNQFPMSQAATPVESTCCSTDYMGGPDLNYNDRCDWSPDTWTTDAWSQINFGLPLMHKGIPADEDFFSENPFAWDSSSCGTLPSEWFVCLQDYVDWEHDYIYTLENDVDDEGAPVFRVRAGMNPLCIQEFFSWSAGGGPPTVIMETVMNPNVTWSDVFDFVLDDVVSVIDCSGGCALIPPDTLKLQFRPVLGGDVVEGDIVLTEEQKQEFVPEAGKTYLNPQIAEIQENLDAIVAGANAYFAQNCQFPASQGQTPVESTCCSSSNLGGPDLDGDNQCDVNTNVWNTNTWNALGFVPEQDHYYIYSFDSSGAGSEAKFTVSAFGDLDCDNIMSTFQRIGFGSNYDDCINGVDSEIFSHPYFFADSETE